MLRAQLGLPFGAPLLFLGGGHAESVCRLLLGGIEVRLERGLQQRGDFLCAGRELLVDAGGGERRRLTASAQSQPSGS